MNRRWEMELATEEEPPRPILARSGVEWGLVGPTRVSFTVWRNGEVVLRLSAATLDVLNPSLVDLDEDLRLLARRTGL